MAEDQCLIQYVRDNFGHEFSHGYVPMGVLDDVGDDVNYGLQDYHNFAQSSPFADGLSSPVTTLAPELHASPSPPSAMESAPYLEAATDCYSPPGEPGLQVPSAFNTHPLLNEKEYPMLASYGLAQACHSDCEGITLDEMLHDQFVNTCKATSGVSSSGCEGEKATSFWRGKSPALLMQQLKGPSLSASSSSSEPRSNLRSSSFQQSPSAHSLAPKTPLNSTGLCNRVGDVQSYTFGGEPGSKLSSSPGFSRQRSLPPLGDVSLLCDSPVRFKSGISPGRSGSGAPRVIQRSNSLQLHGDDEHGEFAQGNIKQRRKIMPGLAIFGEMQRNAVSGNNSWSCSSTSPGPSSHVDQENGLLVANFDKIRHKNSYNSSAVSPANVSQAMSPAMSVGREIMSWDRLWKKPKPGELQGLAVSEDAVQAAILATAMVEQKEKHQLREKFLALLQIDSSTSKNYKAQILDDTIKYLKELRRRLNFNETDSTPSTEASPTSSPRCRPSYGEGLASPVRFKDLELETAGVEISPHCTVEGGPHIEVRMMENQHVMVKLTAKDRPGLFNDIVVALRSLRMDIQHANIRTGNNGQRHDIFAAKMQVPLFSSQSTHTIAMALNQVISASASPLASPERYTPQVLQ